MRIAAQLSIFLCFLVGLELIIEASEFAPGTAATFEEKVLTFFDRHCMECHDSETAKAGLDLEKLGTQFVSEPSAEWIEIMDAINLGEMPPEDEPRPDPAESFAVVKWIAKQLTYAEKEAKAAGGQVPMRRLNRDEFANTVRDLLELDENLLGELVEDLPGDGKAEGFDRLGVALFFDKNQIERTLSAAEAIADLAIVDPDKKPFVKPKRFEAEFRPWDRHRTITPMGIQKVSEVDWSRFDGKEKVPLGAKRYRFIEDGVIFSAGRPVFVRGDRRGRMADVTVDDLITEDGYYTIRVRGGADPGPRGEPIVLSIVFNLKTSQQLSIDVPFNHSIDKPGVVEVVIFIPRGAEDQSRRISLLYNHLPDYIITTEEYDQLSRDRRDAGNRLRRAREAGEGRELAKSEAFLKDVEARIQAWKGPLRQINPNYVDKEPPRFFLDWMEFEGPLKEEFPPKSHQTLFFGGDKRRDLNYAREVVSRFLPKAYRRPVEEAEVKRVVDLIAKEMKKGKDFYSAFRIGLARILVSPGFVFIQEPSAEGSRSVNDYELASRLSYFLWSTMPDDELFELAEQGNLSRPETLRNQVSRMLADSRSREFVENFAGQWLNVRAFGSVPPAENLYREYDKALEESSKLEAYAFFEEILNQDLPITNFLDSEFVMINERLARHYEIEDIEGEDFQRVPLQPGHHRGGVLGMAGLMTLLADGTRTLPVRRAAWVMENLFNDPPPPPPPNAGEVQPNADGENLTVRERLELHRDEPTCASCHATLDPYGLGLENYDAIGRWRTKQNGEGFRRNKAPGLVIKGELPTGQAFDSLESFKSALLEEKDTFAKAFSERMLTYALGRPVGYSDRETIQSFVDALKSNEYRIQSLIQAVVVSDAFQTK